MGDCLSSNKPHTAGNPEAPSERVIPADQFRTKVSDLYAKYGKTADDDLDFE